MGSRRVGYRIRGRGIRAEEAGQCSAVRAIASGRVNGDGDGEGGGWRGQMRRNSVRNVG